MPEPTTPIPAYPSNARVCALCGTPVRPGDGGIQTYGMLFCSEECADERDVTRGW